MRTHGTRRRRSAPIHVPTLERRIRELGKTLLEVVEGARSRRIPCSVATFQRALRQKEVDESSIVRMADILGIATDELLYGPIGGPARSICDRDSNGATGALDGLLALGFTRDAQRMIQATDLLDLRNVELELRRFGSNATAARFESFYADLARQTARLSARTHRPPRSRGLLAEGRGLRVRCQQTLFTTLLLLEYLQHFEKIPLQVDLHVRHSALGMLTQMEHDASADIVALPLVTSVLYYRQTEDPLYRPIALLPRGSHRLVDFSREKTCRREVVLLPGTATAPAYFDALRRHGVLEGDAVGLPCDPMAAIRPSEVEATSAVLWFPRNVIYEVLHDGRYLDPGDLEVSSKESVLLMRRDLLEDDKTLRDEILELVTHAQAVLRARLDLIPTLVQRVFGRDDFKTALSSEVEYASSLAG